MIIEKLSLTDFRVFKGKHDFDLSPRKKYGKRRPIILYGGLNGAGKTTTLAAIRLALYGKQSLGAAVSKREYDDFLAKSIHRSRDALLQANSANVELSFSYGNLGVIKHYSVKRQWTLNKNAILENLTIAEDGNILSELNQDQCQGFLNELIPIGVSELFFFDAEKISELAKDTGGSVLGESIKKLLGLDIIETLDSDITVLLRNASKKAAPDTVRQDIEKLEHQLKELEIEAEKHLTNWEQSKTQSIEHSKIIEKLENELSVRGGAWAANRDKELARYSELRSEKQVLESQLRELISGNYPISIAARFATATLKQLGKERMLQRKHDTAATIGKHIASLKSKLSKALDKAALKHATAAIDREFNSLLDKGDQASIIHGLSERAMAIVEASILDATDQQNSKAVTIAKKLELIEENIERLDLNIARAPEESTIKPILEKINKEQEKRAACVAKQQIFIEQHKNSLRSAIDVARKLDKISENLSTDEGNDRTIKFANDSKLLLKEFSIEMSKRKVKNLELEFIKSFKRLSRKDDIGLTAKIDPNTFLVKLIGVDGAEIDKNETLSAGEKQIYAISILEALARTSGRKLPIIIDTPLGRLDSEHRSNFINNYFPNASHQVIILSTDTEVDEAFYEDLSDSISHAYKLDYDSKTGSSSGKAGYFWKAAQEEIA